MIGIWSGNPCDGHVIVAASFDLLDTEGFRQPVELAEKMIKTFDNLVGLHTRRNLAEHCDVSEENVEIVVVIGDVSLAVAKSEGNICRKNLAQQGIGMHFLLFDPG